MKRRYKALFLVLIFLISTTLTMFLSSCQPQEKESKPFSIMIQAQEQTDLGVEPGSRFSLETSSAISKEELRGLLSIEPDIGAYKLEGGGKRWTLTPPEPLSKNTVYTFRIHDESGAMAESFAFQTKSDLLVNNVYPHNNSWEVAPDSGIEIVLNTPDVDANAYFDIKPETPGTLKTNGYTVLFQPDAPLKVGNTYRITLKAGLTAPNGMRLNEDYSSKFQVDESSGNYSRYKKLRLEENFSETFLPCDPFVIQLTARDEFARQEYNVQIHKLNDMDAYIDIIRARELYDNTFYGPAAVYTTDTSGLEEIMSYTGQLFRKDERWGALYAILPNSLAEGCYVVSIYDPKADSGKPAIQKLIQISNVSVYSQISNGEILVWLNDPVTGKPIQGAQTALIDETDFKKIADAETDSDGIAIFSTDAKAKNPYLSITQNGIQTYFSPIDFSENSEISLSQKYYNALYTDREIYQPTDTIRIWGALHPHTGDIPMPQYVYAVLSNQDPDPALTRVKVPVNADGTYEGHISFDGLAKDDWYDLYITDGASDYYDSKSLKIGEYTKPAYVIDVEPEKPFFYADEPIVFNLSAAFFDGTPLVNGRLKISGYELSFDGAQSVDDGVTVTLDEYGKASVEATLNSEPDYDYNCLSWEPRSVWYHVSNADAQDLNINEHGTVTVLPSRIGAKLQIGDSPDELLLSAAFIDASKLKGKPPKQHTGKRAVYYRNKRNSHA